MNSSQISTNSLIYFGEVIAIDVFYNLLFEDELDLNELILVIKLSIISTTFSLLYYQIFQKDKTKQIFILIFTLAILLQDNNHNKVLLLIEEIVIILFNYLLFENDSSNYLLIIFTNIFILRVFNLHSLSKL